MHSSADATNVAPHSRLPFYLVVVSLFLAFAGYLAYVRVSVPIAVVDEIGPLRAFIAKMPQQHRLASVYQDADGDLIADGPTDAAKIQTTDVLNFSLFADDDAKKVEAEWRDLLLALEEATGKKVTPIAVENSMAALRNGKLHITAFSTGAVRDAVNEAGFVPLVAPADAQGRYSYEMEILVPAASKAKSPADLKGQSIGFTSLSSNSGAKAPLVLLKQKYGMLPGRDYRVRMTGGHELSIKELAMGRLDAICVANDLLAQAVKNGMTNSDQFRSIYKSDAFPPFCLGVAHDLPPETIEQIKKVLLAYRFAGTSLDRRFAPQGKTQFAAVDYKQDWAFVRHIDDSLQVLLKYDE